MSIQNSIESFFVHVGPKHNLRSKISKKKEVYTQYGMTLQPFMIIQENNQFAVCYDKIFYTFPNILDCLATALKIHCALNLSTHRNLTKFGFLYNIIF